MYRLSVRGKKDKGIRPFCGSEFYDSSDFESGAPEVQFIPPQDEVEEEEKAQDEVKEEESDLEERDEDLDHPGEDEDDETSYDPEYGDSQAYSP